MPLLEASRFFFFASFLAMISAFLAISLSTLAPFLGSLPCNFA